MSASYSFCNKTGRFWVLENKKADKPPVYKVHLSASFIYTPTLPAAAAARQPAANLPAAAAARQPAAILPATKKNTKKTLDIFTTTAIISFRIILIILNLNNFRRLL